MFNLLLALNWFVISVALLVAYYGSDDPQWPANVGGYPLGGLTLLLCVELVPLEYAVHRGHAAGPSTPGRTALPNGVTRHRAAPSR